MHLETKHENKVLLLEKQDIDRADIEPEQEKRLCQRGIFRLFLLLFLFSLFGGKRMTIA